MNIEHKVLWKLSFRTDFCRLRQSDTKFISLLTDFLKDILVTYLFHVFLSMTWKWSPCLLSKGLCINDRSSNLHKSVIFPLKWFSASRTLLYLVYMWSLFRGRAYSSIDSVCQIWWLPQELFKIMWIFCTFLFSEKAWLFKSHLMPGKLTFLTLDDKEYVVS